MDFFEQLKEIRNRDSSFANALGITTTEIREGYAKGELMIRPQFGNTIGSIHGGCLFTLADSIGGAAAASYGFQITTLSSDFQFLAPGIGTDKLYAEAVVIKHGKTINVLDVFIRDEKEKLLAKGTFSYYTLREKITMKKFE